VEKLSAKRRGSGHLLEFGAYLLNYKTVQELCSSPSVAVKYIPMYTLAVEAILLLVVEDQID